MTELWPKIKEETPMVLKVSQRRGWSLWEHFPLNIFALIYLINFPQPFFFLWRVFFLEQKAIQMEVSHTSWTRLIKLNGSGGFMWRWLFDTSQLLIFYYRLNTKNLIFSCREWNISTFLQDQENIKSWYSLV